MAQVAASASPWVPAKRIDVSSGFTKPLADIPLNPGWLIGILIIMAYEIIPIYNWVA